MSDSEEHHFESKADAGASKTYPQQAGTVRKNGYIVIKNRPCKVHILLLVSPLSPYCRQIQYILEMLRFSDVLLCLRCLLVTLFRAFSVLVVLGDVSLHWISD